jgi:hypothetical protein
MSTNLTTSIASGLTAKRSFRLLAGLTAVALSALALSSCNVTRTITTQSQYYQKGDTTCTIVTKTIETYDAKKNVFNGY